MGASMLACCSIAATVAFMAASSFLAVAASSVPAVYVFGDSLADVGNNDYLVTVLKADFSHNGMDYPGGKATGRFSNGKNSADFIGAYQFHSTKLSTNFH
jgi:phospholipase/lecithinase/hemolysin